jgi:hypothetical protein
MSAAFPPVRVDACWSRQRSKMRRSTSRRRSFASGCSIVYSAPAGRSHNEKRKAPGDTDRIARTFYPTGAIPGNRAALAGLTNRRAGCFMAEHRRRCGWS